MAYRRKSTASAMPKPRIDPRSTYTPEYGAMVCERIANGQSLLSFRSDESMPDPQTVYRWIDTYPEFASAFEVARVKSADALIEQAREIADDSKNDTIIIETRSGQVYERVNREWTERSKLRVQMRQWLASRFNPRKFGEKQQIETTVTLELGARLDAAMRYRAEQQQLAAEAQQVIEGDAMPMIKSET